MFGLFFISIVYGFVLGLVAALHRYPAADPQVAAQ